MSLPPPRRHPDIHTITKSVSLTFANGSDFVVAWEDVEPGQSRRIYARRFRLTADARLCGDVPSNGAAKATTKSASRAAATVAGIRIRRGADPLRAIGARLHSNQANRASQDILRIGRLHIARSIRIAAAEIALCQLHR